jgi:hypothetical protein
MAKPNRFDVAEKVGELSPATRETVADALGVDAGSEQLQKAFAGAAEHGLIEDQSGQGGATGWTLSDKGRRRLEEKSRGD